MLSVAKVIFPDTKWTFEKLETQFGQLQASLNCLFDFSI